jgi:hypothetical protein
MKFRKGDPRLEAWEREDAKRRAGERGAPERAAREWQALRAQVLADRDTRAKAVAAEAAEVAGMDAKALAAHYARQQQARGFTSPPPRPTYYNTAAEEIDREDAIRQREERERRERDLGVPEWDARRQEIKDTEAVDLQKARERCRQAEGAARERAEQAREQLGERPTLADLVMA